jgi:hypothetical protein
MSTITAYDDTIGANANATQPTMATLAPGALQAGTAKDPMLADLPTLKRWQRDGVANLLRYREAAEKEEAAIYGEQWEQDELAALEKLGRQKLVHNHIQKAIFALYGWRCENRFEITYRPKEISDTTEADVMSSVAKHYLDASAAEYEIASAALQQYGGPFGVLFVGYESDDPTKEPLKLEAVNWREMRYDRRAKKPDMSDAEWVTRERWIPLAAAQARFPDFKQQLADFAGRGRDGAMGDAENVDHGGNPYSAENTTPMLHVTDKQEVRICETWYRKAYAGHYVQTPTGMEVFEPHNADHQFHALVGGPKAIQPGMIHCVYFATHFGGGILEEGKSPYSHRLFPYVFMWGLKDHLGLPHGAVRAMLDPQKVLNWSQSKLMWLAQSNQWLVKEGAVLDIEAFAASAGRPDGIMEWTGEGDAPQRLDKSGDFQANEALRTKAEDDLKQISGSNEEIRGQQSNADSGIGIQLRQQAAVRQQGVFLDNEERAMMQVGIMWRSMIQDRVTDETIVRITQPNGGDGMGVINVTDPLRRGQLEQQGYTVFGTVTRGAYDTKVVLSPQSATNRESRSREMAQFVKMLAPQQQAAVADLIVMSTDVPDKEKIAQRLALTNQITMGIPMNGQPPPPPGPPDPGGPVPPGGAPPPPLGAPQGPQGPMQTHAPAGPPPAGVPLQGGPAPIIHTATPPPPLH